MMPIAGYFAAITAATRPALAAEPENDAPVEKSPTPAAVAVEPQVEPAPKGHGIPLHSDAMGWGPSIYGFVELDTMYDTTRSFDASVTNNTLARPHTYAGDNPRAQFTVQNSRVGFDLRAPNVASVKPSAVLEADFFGANASSTENSVFAAPILRLRHYYMKFETPVVDVLVGQYHDLYGWGGAGFYPNSVAFLPLLGEIYHRNPQVRLSKVFGGKAVLLEVAVAAVRPAQRDAVMPDGQAGIRLAVKGFKGAATPGASRPTAAPFGVGISALGRRLSVTDFAISPGNEHTIFCGGVAGNLFLPIIPAHGPNDSLSNAVTLTVEGSAGTGVNDMSPGLTGGVLFPSLPNPQMFLPVPVYTPNIDPGIATYDATNGLHTVNWTSLVGNIHYHFPFDDGKRLWVSVSGSVIQSSNSVDLTPFQGRAGVWNKGNYFDANLWISPADPFVLGLSIQRTSQTFGDGISATNYRGEGSCYFFF
jgi:hypothetical protein